ncbi:MAG: geranylgeranylglycerol-phosphate geranylgeranyltransferase [bacterium]
MNNLLESIKIIRLVNCLMAMMGVLIGAILTHASFVYYSAAISSLAAFAVCAAGNILNDLLDIDSDRINRPHRVLVRGALSRRYALIMMFVLNFLGLALAMTVNAAVVTAVIIAIVLLAAYNRYLKRLPLLGNTVIAFLGGLTFVTGAVAAEESFLALPPGPLTAAGIAFFFHLAREVVKDMQDIAGDDFAGVLTLPQRIGPRKSAIVALGLFLCSGVIAMVPVVNGRFSGSYATIAIYLDIVPLLGLMIAFVARPTVSMSKIVSTALKAGMVLGIVALAMA